MNKRPEQTARTKAEIEEAFWRLYTKTPIEKITVGQVCELAGYNRGTFYLHYSDLYALLEEIEERLLGEMTDCVEACMKRLSVDSSKLSCIAACKDVVVFYKQRKSYIGVLLGSKGDPSFVLRLKDCLKPLWRTYVVKPDAAMKEAEINLLLEYTLSGTLFMISTWLANPGNLSAPELAHLVYDFAIKDIKQRSNA